MRYALSIIYQECRYGLYAYTSCSGSVFQVFGFTSLGVISISTLTFVLQTFPDFQDNHALAAGSASTENGLFETILNGIDVLAIYFFTGEYSVRFVCSPRKCVFFKV